MSAEQWTAAGSWATCVVLGITILYAARQVREAAALRREQFRPWMTVGFHFRSNIAFIAVKNLGTTPARDVRIQMEPPLASTLGQFEKAALFSEVTPVFVPGEERLVLLDRVPNRLRSELPGMHTAIVTYKDHRGNKLPPERFVLDFDLLDGAKLPDKGIHDLVEEAIRIRAQMGAGGDVEPAARLELLSRLRRRPWRAQGTP